METPAPRRPAAQAPRPAAHPSQPATHPRRNKRRALGFAAIGIAVIVLVGVILLGASLLSQARSGGMKDVKTGQYQAVFLNNNQVYFGKISTINDEHIVLNDIYYLQVQQGVQPEEKTQDNQQLSLAKLGGELHGPEDTMYINADQVLFWENLKDDGKVVQAIKSNSK